ncbi:UNVERIFIED_CONTAM: hypothetical protein GTU68_018779 [Idotea baltica]|nr:hypothetical protein [Idotea baltica]
MGWGQMRVMIVPSPAFLRQRVVQNLIHSLCILQIFKQQQTSLNSRGRL